MSYYQNTPIRNWIAEDRPREKMMSRGMGSLTDAELIATILSTGTREHSAIDLGRKLLGEFGSLKAIAMAAVPELMRVRGIGKAKATSIAAAFELARRKLKEQNSWQKLYGPDSIADYLRPRMIDLNHEIFYVIYLNKNNIILGEKLIAKGGVSATVIDPRLIYREALNLLATAVVLSHNHPSGNMQPSEADDNITRKLVEAGEVMDISVLDHLILSPRGYFSYSENGRLKRMKLAAEAGFAHRAKSYAY